LIIHKKRDSPPKKTLEVIGIAAVTVNGYIARHSREKILWSKDRPLFKKQTENFPVIMGSNTHKTLSDGLPGREMIVVNRTDDPVDILRRIDQKRCFVIGGGKTYSKFSSYLTHLYLTIHPQVFKRGIRLFTKLEKEVSISFIRLVPVVAEEGIFQFQFKVE
jgi:dihydrofolate reductase